MALKKKSFDPVLEVSTDNSQEVSVDLIKQCAEIVAENVLKTSDYVVTGFSVSNKGISVTLVNGSFEVKANIINPGDFGIG